jgi:Kdo2-lipid IVA lauroyltransferase/acyltransferase
MYYIIYPLLYLISLLPFFVLYGISNAIAAFLYHVLKYRRDVVMNNLQIAFPEKSEVERVKIAKQFYRYFTDTFIETLKFISISKAAFLKRTTGNFEMIHELENKGYNINLLAGHQFNWEFVNHLYILNLTIPFVGIYMPISNKAFDRIIFDIRKRYGTVLVSATEFKTRMHQVFSGRFAMGLAADQNPPAPNLGYWMLFFNRPTPFLTGPERGAVRHNLASVYVEFKKVKRGYYHFEATLLAKPGEHTGTGELTKLYKNKLEETIRQDPANYLWSHRRFKYEYKEEYGEIIG